MRAVTWLAIGMGMGAWGGGVFALENERGDGGFEGNEERLPLPSYHFGAGIAVECMERDV
ncbi:hypothetical protein BofuT4_uP104620.1 [Botrytis cinerea T4]|nr:hypothetical protein BofuT4_uP104620.1 [Botrytis cinerea T4]